MHAGEQLMIFGTDFSYFDIVMKSNEKSNFRSCIDSDYFMKTMC